MLTKTDLNKVTPNLTQRGSKQSRVMAAVEIIRNETLRNPDRSSSGKLAIQAENLDADECQ